MANVLLGVTGSVAAVKTPEIVAGLRADGHTVQLVVTESSLYFFDPADLPDVTVYRDRDEWPGDRYTRGDPVLHIRLRTWADVVVIAPLDANTLAKLALGLCDNCLTCVWRARDVVSPCVLAPAMNTMMWTAPVTARHLRQLTEDNPHLRVVAPVEKRLACDDVGTGALAEPAVIVTAVRELLAEPSVKVAPR